MSFDGVLEIEESFWKSSGDQDFYKLHVADEGRFVLSMGVMSKRDVVEAMSHAEPWKSFEILEPSLIPIDEDVVGLVYEATGQRDDDSDEYNANILSVYRRVNQEWQLILHQQTPLG